MAINDTSLRERELIIINEGHITTKGNQRCRSELIISLCTLILAFAVYKCKIM